LVWPRDAVAVTIERRLTRRAFRSDEDEAGSERGELHPEAEEAVL